MSEGTNIEKIDLDKVDWRGSREFFESLGETLDRLNDKDETYDFTWVGKRKAVVEAGAPINKTLRPDLDASKNWDTTENLFIEGDNLDALKLLQESYLGKVKMIYIDPPYNTGKDFVYHDNFKASVENYDEDTEYKNEAGNIQFKKNEKSNGRYHSDWLSMMYPRLKLARNLLTDDGVIFISIGDDEQANLKKMCDEIYSEDNFVDSVVWKKRYQGAKEHYHAAIHEYVLVYARNKGLLEDFSMTATDEFFKKYFKGRDAKFNVRGGYRTQPLEAGGTMDIRTNLRYDIELPDGRVIKPKKQWIWSKERVQKAIMDDMLDIVLKPDGTYSVRFKQYEKNEDGVRSRTKPFSIVDFVFTQDGTKEINDLIGAGIFQFPKPSKYIKHFIDIISAKDKSYTVLDFFSGSGTTAQAVMQLNSEDGGSRKWITVQLPEETDEKSEAYKAGYKTIPEISRERVRRAGDKIAAEHPDAKVDYGFRSLVIADTNYKEVYKSAGEQQQSTLLDVVDNIKDDRSDLDLLYGVLTQSALELNRPCKLNDLEGSNVFLYDYFSEVSGLAACFSSSVPEETIKEIAKLKPLTAVFRDSSFATSQDKVNLAEHFRIISPETKVKVI